MLFYLQKKHEWIVLSLFKGVRSVAPLPRRESPEPGNYGKLAVLEIVNPHSVSMYALQNSIWISWDFYLQVAGKLTSNWLLKEKGICTISYIISQVTCSTMGPHHLLLFLPPLSFRYFRYWKILLQTPTDHTLSTSFDLIHLSECGEKWLPAGSLHLSRSEHEERIVVVFLLTSFYRCLKVILIETS